MTASWLLSRGKHGSGKPASLTSVIKSPDAAAAAALALAGAVFIAPSANAVHELNLIELEGNAVTDNAATTTGTRCKAVTITNDTTSSIPDQCASARPSAGQQHRRRICQRWIAERDHLTGAGPRDPNSLTQWARKDQAGGLPDKDNLQHAFAAGYSIPEERDDRRTAPDAATNCEVLFFGSDRFDNSGDAQQGFWFFQNKIGLGPHASAAGRLQRRHHPGRRPADHQRLQQRRHGLDDQRLQVDTPAPPSAGP